MKYMVMYAKMVDDKDMGIVMTGVYFGGVCDSEEEADILATKCVSETQGGLIIPKVAKMYTECVRSMASDLTHQFDKLADQMYENEKTLGD